MKKFAKNHTAGIYDRWLYTLGGGEQVAFAYAETLRDLGYKVTILTHKEVDLQQAILKMGINLDGIDVRYLPPSETKELSQYTEEYDVFINTSYADYFPNRSKLGILSVFFPSQIFLSPFEYVKRALFVPGLRRFFIYPTTFEGFTYDEYQDGKIYKWLGKSSRIRLNQNVRHFQITVFFPAFAFSVVDSCTFRINGQPLTPDKKQVNHKSNTVTFSFAFPPSKHQLFTVELPNSDTVQAALVRVTIPGLRYALYNLFKRTFPTWEMRLHGGPGVTKLSDILSYQSIITISEFSRHWIQKYWGISSNILYPPVNTEAFKPADKKKQWIIHVGRFFVSGHNKKQLEMIKVFRQMVDAGQVKDWELHFVGSIHEGERHAQYFEEIKHLAEGYPVVFHTNVPLKDLRSLLGKASIYWHATGLDEDIDSNPIVFEHFGITTVEAMAAGCVPIVIAAGGQKEIVTPDSGFTWRTREELKEHTQKVIADSNLRKNMALLAQKRSDVFSRKSFEQRFEKLLGSQA